MTEPNVPKDRAIVEVETDSNQITSTSESTNRTKKTVENRYSFYLDIGLTNTGCTAQLTIPSPVNAPGNFFLII